MSTLFWFARMIPIIVTATNPDSACSTFEHANTMTTNISVAGFCRESGIQYRLRRKTIMEAPAAPRPNPITMVFNIPNATIVAAVWEPPIKITSKTSTARIAPMGSLMMPSHFATDPIRLIRCKCCSMGMITVGPVTMSIAPKSNANEELNFRI